MMNIELHVKRLSLSLFFLSLASLLSTFTYAKDVIDAKGVKQAWIGLLAERFIKQTEFSFVENNEKLPNVLLYGDSISIDYTSTVRDSLAGKANVYRIHLNVGDSSTFIPKMTKMHEAMQDSALMDAWSFNWHVIHFNVGLHDLKYLKDRKLDKVNGKHVHSIEQYENNLKNIVIDLKNITPKAKLIFANTTPILEGELDRVVGDSVKYNSAAVKVLKAFPEVIINDLYAFTKPNHNDWWQKVGYVHYNNIGIKAQGNEVAQHIFSQLKINKTQIKYK